ncbi:MAG: 1-deoxy-D-xylulose-5-phosphate synthase [Acidimicrobiia bacterium]|nr:1-deoxy-D-xylulose-5-phosphate synthase [Acidimicrobiia bacterium]
MSTETILDRINEPSDLRSLSHDELHRLCDEIREFIVRKVSESKSGGHLGSNLGIVELTVALHRVLDSPNDVILFDTGHQAYVHKILSGRKDAFDQLREADGLSGYPSQIESPHDWIENSHASTALGYAHGLATAFAAGTGPAGARKRRVVAIIGDGSMTGGMAFEGLNNLGHAGSDVTIVLNDNGRSYAPTVSLLSESLVKIRSNPVYMKRQRRFESFTAKLPVIGRWSQTGIRASKAAIREALEPQAFFEPLGVRYMGPFDGHDIAEIEQALINAGEFSGPVVLHVQTQKGRGYGPAENDPIKNMHDIGAVKPGSYTAAFSEAMVKLGEEHPDLVAITAAMPDSTGLLPFRDRFGDRLIDVGIAEQHAVTAAAGMAMGGLRPVVALYSTFLTRAIDQTNLDVGLHRQPVIFCLDRAGITGDDGPSHHGVLDMVLASKVPGMTILCPSSYQELQQMLADAYEITTGPVCIRWPKTAAPSVPDDEIGHGLNARLVRSGSDVCIIGVGKMLAAARAAADELEAEGISATVWDPRAAKPFDESMLDNAASHPLVVTVEDGLADGGIGAGIDLALAQRAGSEIRPEVRVLGVPTRFIPHGKPDAILAELGLDGSGVAATIRAIVNR